MIINHLEKGLLPTKDRAFLAVTNPFIKMASTAHSIEFQSVVKQFPTAIRRKNFTTLVHRILGIAAYNGYDVNGYFPVTQKALKGCDSG